MKTKTIVLADFAVVIALTLALFDITPSAYAALPTKPKILPKVETLTKTSLAPGGEKKTKTKSKAPSSSFTKTIARPTKQIPTIDEDKPAKNAFVPELFFVKRVVDGDTIELENGEKVRYIGMDTPESVDPRKPVQCFAKEASKKNEEMVLNQQVNLEKDVTDRDKYGRLLRYVYVHDTFVNLELVKSGYARIYTYPPDVKYNAQLLEAEKEARTNNRGLWSACNDQKAPQPITPSPLPAIEPSPQKTTLNYGPSSKQNDSPPPSLACDIKGNINNKKEKIYHLPGCLSYNQTKIDMSRGEHYFCSEQEALAAGWRKALNCP